MNISICTISFRHHLYAIEHLAEWAGKNNFQGIELWGAHAYHLAADGICDAAWMKANNLYVSMISHYLPMHALEPDLTMAMKQLSKLGHYWDTPKLRVFAGQEGSADINRWEREKIVKRLRQLCCYAETEGQTLLIETHPGTLADNVYSTLQLLEEVDHSALRINFDVLHVWESGADPVQAFKVLRDAVSHLHFKNIASREQLSVFQPHNVYAAAGDREGMVPLFEGVVDYAAFVREARPTGLEASLEWFGPRVKEVLRHDRRQLEAMMPASGLGLQQSPQRLQI